MLISLLAAAACAQQDVTPPPGPDVIAEGREPQPADEAVADPSEPVPSARVVEVGPPWVLRSADGRQSVEFQVKLDMDWAYFDPEDGLEAATGDWNDGAELRRARLGLRGHLDTWLNYKLSADLADAEIRDAWVDVEELLPRGTLRFGHFREPIGLSNQTPSHNQTFIERTLPTELFPSRNLGLAWREGFDADRGVWHVGVFRETDDDGVSADGGEGNELALTTRLVWLPYTRDGDAEFVHVGGSFSWRNPDDGMVDFAQGAGTKIGPDLIATGPIPADEVYLLGGELAWLDGPTSLQFEYFYAGFDQPGGTSPGMKGWSFEASRFLTGETRGYKRGRAAFWEVEPLQPFDPNGPGMGAFEVGFRAARLDLQDEGVTGGDGLELALAWNWYLTRALRFQTNLVRADREAAGDVHALLFRFHLRF